MPDIYLRPGEANPSDVLLRDTTAADGAAFTSTVTFDQAAATWAATAAETFAATATVDQPAATWAASAAETYTSTATFSQAAASWAATGAEAFAASGSFSQAAATWDATAGEAFPATGAWTQAAATWAGAATNVAPPASLTATFDQAAASWGSTFAGGTDTSLPPVGTSDARRLVRALYDDTRSHTAVAAFSQAPASWAAQTVINDDELVILLAA